MSQHTTGQAPPSGAPRFKIGGRLGAIDPQAIAKAEAALKSLSGNFAQWLQDEITKLHVARQALATGGVTADTMESFYLRAHDLKGLGATYGFPLVTRVAASLCRQIDDKEKRLSASLELIDAHIDAIVMAVAKDMKTDDDPIGRRLAEDLEARVIGLGL